MEEVKDWDVTTVPPLRAVRAEIRLAKADDGTRGLMLILTPMTPDMQRGQSVSMVWGPDEVEEFAGRVMEALALVKPSAVS
jgi:hypothetical protein